MKIYDGALWLTGDVGKMGDFEYFTQTQVREALASHGPRDLTVYINSGGGRVHEGLAIFNLLKSHERRVTVVVDGIAASAGSVIAMAGDEIVMRRGSYLMIHDPAQGIHGTPRELEETAKALNGLADELAKIYSARSGTNVDVVRQLMIAETWFSPEQAVAKGFADRVEELGARVAAHFAYGQAYAHAPERLKTMEAGARLRGIVLRDSGRQDRKQASGDAVATPGRVGSFVKAGASLREIVDHANMRGRKP